ncbi:MAG: hypothetical protein Q4F83_11140 [Eubacteriales bacterium]|nr:hypothetical protein [Eubacteriales bacterium]
MSGIEYRPVRVTERRRTKLGTETTVSEGLFHCWASEQWTYSPMMRGQVGGQMQSTYGIIEMKDGSVKKVSPEEIQFLDNKAFEYPYPEEERK